MVHVSSDVAVRRATPLNVHLLVVGLEAVSAAASIAPRRLAEPVCGLAGLIWCVLAPIKRAAVRDNLRHMYGREPRLAEVMAVFQYGLLNYWDTFAIPHLSPQQVVDLVDLQGREHLDAALAKGCGVILAGAHLGSVALAAQVLPALGYKMVGLVEPINPPEVHDFFARQRQAHGARLLPSRASAVRELLQALRCNEVVGLVTDRDVSGNGTPVPFFDAPTRFPDGAATLSVRTGAPILIAVSVRKDKGRFDAWIEPLPTVASTGDTRADTLAITRAIARRLEYHIASHPDQWTVFQRRWPHQPSG